MGRWPKAKLNGGWGCKESVHCSGAGAHTTYQAVESASFLVEGGQELDHIACKEHQQRLGYRMYVYEVHVRRTPGKLRL